MDVILTRFLWEICLEYFDNIILLSSPKTGQSPDVWTTRVLTTVEHDHNYKHTQVYSGVSPVIFFLGILSPKKAYNKTLTALLLPHSQFCLQGFPPAHRTSVDISNETIYPSSGVAPRSFVPADRTRSGHQWPWQCPHEQSLPYPWKLSLTNRKNPYHPPQHLTSRWEATQRTLTASERWGPVDPWTTKLLHLAPKTKLSFRISSSGPSVVAGPHSPLTPAPKASTKARDTLNPRSESQPSIPTVTVAISGLVP